MKTKIFHIIFLVLIFFGINMHLLGQEISIGPEEPSNLRAFDHPWDHGDKIDLEWIVSKDDPGSVAFYSIFRSDPSNPGSFIFIDNVDPGIDKFTIEKLKKEESYYFRVSAVDDIGNVSDPALITSAISPSQQWFDGRRFPLFLITLIFCGSVVYWIYHARSGRPLKIRKIAGLEAVDEAVGRATEMGRSILFIPGIQDMNEIQTIAGMTVLSRVAKVAAEYDARVEVPTSRSLVMTAARETVQASFLTAGRPESYNQDLVYYVTDEQFGYVAYVQGMMVREKPAACFYMGAFFAESLISTLPSSSLE